MNLHRYAVVAVVGLLSVTDSRSQAVSTGCPQFHCTPGATSVMTQSIISSPNAAAISAPTAFGQLQAQGCSGNGTVVACVYPLDPVKLKVLNANLTSTVWTSSTPGLGIYPGQVPFFFGNGDIGVGDKNKYYRFTGSGALVSPALTLWNPGAANVGLTYVGNSQGIISQSDGSLTLIDMTTMAELARTQLTTALGAAISFQSPPAGADGVLYVIAKVPGSLPSESHLFAVSVHAVPGGWQLSPRIDMQFSGTSGASPVVTRDPAYAGNIVLLPTKSGATNSLLALEDNLTASTFGSRWSRTLADNLLVTPTVDEANQRVYFQYTKYAADPSIVQLNLQTGAVQATYNIKTLFSRAPDFELAGHISAIADGVNPFTILVVGNETATGAAFAVQPAAVTPAVWQKNIPKASAYGAWNLLPSTIPGTYCPTLSLLGSTNNGVIKICN